ncbi:MAG: 4-(cytidine 5'-diphospho)-2-C-methyl-D-erythritol kinase [Ferruginibacter sp.]
MLSFPNCKINLGLHILGKRADGYHNLETVFYPVALKDALELIPATNSTTGIQFTATGLAVDGNTADNLCVKAYHLLQKDFPQLPAVQVHLHKSIPMGAGLGGGSADASCMLQLLNERFHLNLSADQLIQYALRLGSDCPFFIINKPCFATGRGEVLEEIRLDLTAYKIVLINPGIHVNTGRAFSNITPALPLKSIREIIQQPADTWKAELANDFEKPVFAAYPEVKTIKDSLYEQGAVYASMSGSGSTVFGIFHRKASPVLPENSNYFIKIIN